MSVGLDHPVDRAVFEGEERDLDQYHEVLDGMTASFEFVTIEADFEEEQEEEEEEDPR